jgi:hypothetical protein
MFVSSQLGFGSAESYSLMSRVGHGWMHDIEIHTSQKSYPAKDSEAHLETKNINQNNMSIPNNNTRANLQDSFDQVWWSSGMILA